MTMCGGAFLYIDKVNIVFLSDRDDILSSCMAETKIFFIEVIKL